MLPQLEKADWKKFVGKSIFIDAKLHDIPTQVGDAVKIYRDLGASFLTLHLSGGRAMLEEAAKATQGSSLRLLGVSVLTSLSERDLGEIGFAQSLPEAQVMNLIGLGMQSGVESFVSSAREIKSILHKFPQAYIATPGLTLDGTLQADQSRGASLQEALDWGSRMGIVGRAIINDQNPRAKAQEALSYLA